ncbi:neutral zinc metallopeptidase [Mycolicibacterium phlei]
MSGLGRSTRWSIVLVCALIALVGCGSANTTKVEGRAVSMLFNPERVGGLPVEEGPSGPRPDAPAPEGRVTNTNGGQLDELVLSAVNDIEEFWAKTYPRYLPGEFEPVRELVSYDSGDPDSPVVCGAQTYDMPNAFFCFRSNVLAWDRGLFIPIAQQYFGDMGAVGVIAHEYGHALQWMAGLVDEDTDGLVREQQADCFAGVYLRSVAAGESPRFTLSTGEGLNRVLAGAIFIRDPPLLGLFDDPHGSALDRVSAFQMGFTGNAEQCAAIDSAEIEERRGDLPRSVMVFDDTGSLDSPIDESTLGSLMTALGDILQPAEPPTLTTEATDCPDVDAPAVYCPVTNEIYIDLPALQKAGEPKNEQEDQVLVQGDNTALSMVTSRYVLALQQERGVDLDTPVAALRTACLTGVAQGRMNDETGVDFVLSPGDADEAVAGLLTNGVVASDVNGVPALAGFTRILAYRLGLSSTIDECFQRFS